MNIWTRSVPWGRWSVIAISSRSLTATPHGKLNIPSEEPSSPKDKTGSKWPGFKWAANRRWGRGSLFTAANPSLVFATKSLILKRTSLGSWATGTFVAPSLPWQVPESSCSLSRCCWDCSYSTWLVLSAFGVSTEPETDAVCLLSREPISSSFTLLNRFWFPLKFISQNRTLPGATELSWRNSLCSNFSKTLYCCNMSAFGFRFKRFSVLISAKRFVFTWLSISFLSCSSLWVDNAASFSKSAMIFCFFFSRTAIVSSTNCSTLLFNSWKWMSILSQSSSIFAMSVILFSMLSL